MDCIQLQFPPLPQFITVGYGLWQPGNQHFERNFNVYDMLFVTRGTLYMSEDGIEYAIGAGEMLVLEAGKNHVGYRPCEEETDIYWTHFYHEAGGKLVPGRQIQWNSILQTATDRDSAPREYAMYLPKFGKFDPGRIVPIFQSMLASQGSLLLRDGLALHDRLIQLLIALQQSLETNAKPSPSLTLSRRLEAYLRERSLEPFSELSLESEFHFNTEYLSRCLKKHTGMTAIQYSHYLKIEEAKRLLASTAMPVPLVAEKVGIPDYNYFIRLFRSKTGATPGHYRKLSYGLM